MKNQLLFLFSLLVSLNISAQTEPRLVLPVGHTGSLNDIAISDDERLIAFASNDGSITVWDYKTQTLLSKLNPFSGNYIETHLEFFPKSDSLFCYISDYHNGISSQPKKILIYDLANSNERPKIIDLDTIQYFNYNNDGKIANYGILKINWNEESKHQGKKGSSQIVGDKL